MSFPKNILFLLILINISGFALAQTLSTQSPAAPSTSFEAGKKIVKAVEVKGNKSISISVILSKIKTRVGEEYMQSVISDDLKRLYNTGYFADVRVDRQEETGGFKVVFYVEEKPIIDEITFTKLRYYKPNYLLKKLKSERGKFLDNKSLKDDVETIEELYSKKGLTLVNVKVDKNVDELTNKAKLHFIIKEGVRVKVKKIQVNGNKHFKYKQIIRAIKTRPAWLFNPGFLKEEVAEEDMARIKSLYEREGFIDAVASVKYEDYSKSYIKVIIQIEEGKQYYVENITVEGHEVLSRDEIIKGMTEIKAGKVFSRERLTVDLASIRSLYFDRGYIFANVREATSLNPDTGKVEIRLQVSEGKLAYINRIKIEGNDRTRDIVIRRELRLYPGDRFDGEKLRRSKERLRNLGYFEDISYDIQDTDISDHKDLVVQVKEAKTGSFSFGGGFSTVDQVVGFVEIEQKNFDFTNWPTFTGGGQSLLLRAEAGSTRTNTRLSFTEPWLFDYPISLGLDAFATERTRERDVGYAYDEKRVGGSIRFGKRFTEYLSGTVGYSDEVIRIDNFEDNVAADLLAEQGTNTVSSVTLGGNWDGRDSVFNPTKGLLMSAYSDVAGGGLGGDKDFYRVRGQMSYDIPIDVKLKTVLEFRVNTGIVNSYGDSEAVPIFERFFAGGARSIRGYDERHVGPLDSVNSDPIGGEALLVANVEYTIPIIDFLKFATFIDTGNVWSKVEDYASGGFKSGTGMGLRVKTPVGPVNLDYGYPLNDEPGEEGRKGKFYFSVSRGF